MQRDFGRLDILVNNVGIQYVSPVHEASALLASYQQPTHHPAQMRHPVEQTCRSFLQAEQLSVANPHYRGQ